MRKRPPPEGQGSLFAPVEDRDKEHPPRRSKSAAKPDPLAKRKWRMPELQGRTVAEIRLRWTKRLTPAQVARVEAELGALPKSLTKLGFGPVQVERVFVRRRRK